MQKLKVFLSPRRVMAFVGLLVLIVIAQTRPIGAQTITQGYTADDTLQRSTIVSINAEDTTKVAATTYEDIESIQGVIVTANDAPLTLSNQGAEQVYVASQGRFEVLVSNEAGPINIGDYVTVSHLAGVGMKANEETRVVGKAVSAFDGTADVVSTAEVSTETYKFPVSIGRVYVDIAVGGNPLLSTGKADRNFLYQLADRVAQKEVNPVRVYIALVILFVSAAVAGLLLYAGIRNGMIAIGRNPLSRRSIMRSLLQVVVTGFIILLLGIFGVYLLLRL